MASLLGGFTKKREQHQLELQRTKEQMERDTARATSDMSAKFAARVDDIEEKMKIATYGLVTLDEMKAHREAVEAEKLRQVASKSSVTSAGGSTGRKQRQASAGALSFDFNEDGEDEEAHTGVKAKNSKSTVSEREAGEDAANDDDAAPQTAFKRKRFGKDPAVDTSFLPDRDREEQEQRERDAMLEDIKKKRELMKQEKINVSYAYWDGSAHFQTLEMRKGNTIAEFLQAVLLALRSEFSELRGVSNESLIFVKVISYVYNRLSTIHMAVVS